MTFPLGLALGVAPAVMAFAVLRWIGVPKQAATPACRPLLIVSWLSVLLMAAGMDLIFLSQPISVGIPVYWIVIAGAATGFVLSLSLCVVERGTGSR